MPVCQGRPNGPCPDGKNDSNVKWSTADLFLCDDCEKFRFPIVIDNTQSTGQEVAASLNICAVYNNTTSNNSSIDGSTQSHVHSELLCFMQQKSRILTFDDLIDICTDFYRPDEVKAGHAAMLKFVKQRLPVYKGSEKEKSKKTLIDLLKQILDPKNCLPLFYAVDLSRLPPVGITHVDIAAMLQELTSLRSEVRSVSMLRNEIDELRTIIMMKPPQSCRLHEMGQVPETQLKVIQDLPSMPLDSNSPNVTTQQTSTRSSQGYDASSKVTSHTGGQQRSTAQVVRSAVEAGLLVSTSALARKPIIKPIIGVSSGNKIVRAANTTRLVEVFVSRLHPTTTVAEMTDSVNFIKGDIQVHEVNCDKLPVKYEHLYSSFRVKIRVDAADMSKALDLYMSADAWPTGVLVRRFFKPKDGTSKQS